MPQLGKAMRGTIPKQKIWCSTVQVGETRKIPACSKDTMSTPALTRPRGTRAANLCMDNRLFRETLSRWPLRGIIRTLARSRFTINCNSITGEGPLPMLNKMTIIIHLIQRVAFLMVARVNKHLTLVKTSIQIMIPLKNLKILPISLINLQVLTRDHQDKIRQFLSSPQ